MTTELKVRVEDGIQIITIDRPEAKNAMSLAVATAIAAAIDELESNNDLRVAIVTGANSTFCSGMDLKGFLRGERPSIPGRGFGGLTEKSPSKPLIAAVEGYALAGGFELALACDLIVAADNAKFGVPEVKRGLVAAAGGVMRLPKRIPYHIAMEYALTGDFMPAAQAHQFGLVNRLVPAGTALDGAIELARKIVANGPLALAASKRIVQESADWDQSEMWAKQAEIIAPVFSSADAREGALAFAEKRAPKWTGK
ncbi:MAG: crotonase/enoyl-CoA hydratase family protein [Burkholderiaceae bacterium]